MGYHKHLDTRNFESSPGSPLWISFNTSRGSWRGDCSPRCSRPPLPSGSRARPYAIPLTQIPAYPVFSQLAKICPANQFLILTRLGGWFLSNSLIIIDKPSSPCCVGRRKQSFRKMCPVSRSLIPVFFFVSSSISPVAVRSTSTIRIRSFFVVF